MIKKPTNLSSFFLQNTFTTIIKLSCISVCIVLTIEGCGPIVTDNRLPLGAPRGYVEFSGNSFIETNKKWSVWKSENGKVTRLNILKKSKNYQNDIDIRGLKFRHPEQPGIYDYVVSYGSSEKEVTVEVIEGMITPVKVTITPLGTDVLAEESRGLYGKAWVESHRFDMSLSVEQPVFQ